MPPFRPSFKSNSCLTYHHAAILWAVTLALLVRYAPSSLALSTIPASVTVRLQLVPRHGQCFDHEDSQWVSPPAATVVIPSSTTSPQLAPIADPFVKDMTDGSHYNRPPPIQ
jgi:hypothetical protein